MRICKCTIVAQQLNDALGTGLYQHITADEVWRHIDDGSIFRFLSDLLDIRIPLSILTPADRLELLLEWTWMRGCVEPFRKDGDLNGLCLLVGYLLEGAARRAFRRNYRLTTEVLGGAVPDDPLDDTPKHHADGPEEQGTTA